MKVATALRALANERRLLILDWLRDPKKHFREQADGDLIEDGVCGVLIAETFLVDQAAIGHPSDPRFLLGHGELRALAGGLEVEEYREGLVTYPNGERAFRASMVARRKSN